ncbi:MAG: glycosyltransferase family 4 protein, partial [Patescibacteria group bacterium]
VLKDEHEVTTYAPQTMTPWLKYGHGAFLPQLFFKLSKFDYIYLHYPFFGSAEIVWFFKLFFKKPKLVIHYHMDVKNLSLITRLLSYPSLIIRRSLFKQADMIVSASLDYVQQSQIADIYKRYPEKFREIPFGVDLKKFQAKLIPLKSDNKIEAYAKKIVNYVKDKFIRKNSLNLIFVGGLDKAHYFKGISILLNSLFLLEPKSWRLQIIGDGDMRSEYETLSKNLNLDDRVEFKGRLNDNDLIKAIQNSDLLILPSINNNEAFGIVLIEALACGVPVIASDLPGVRRVFTDKQEGLLFKTGDIQDLKNKLEFILKHEEERKKMALAARELAEKKYSLTALENNLKKIFKD